MKAGTRGRQRWVRVHRWLGVGLLVFWIVMGLSGSALVLYREVLNHLRPVQAASPAMPIDLDGVHRALRAAHPDRRGAWRIELPLEAGDPVVARYMKPAESAGKAFAPLMVWVDPVSLQVRHQVLWGSEPMTWLYDLHLSLLLDADGRHIVGALGVLMTVSLVSGLILWWPRPGRWRQAWAFKRQASVERQVYDVHKLAGAGGALLLLILCVSGVLLTWHRQIEPWLNRVSPLFEPPAPVISGMPDQPLARLAAVAQGLFPRAHLRWVETAGWQGGQVRVQMWQPGEPSRRFPRTQVWLDAHTGEVRATRDGLTQQAGDAFLAWLHPLHNGEAAGWVGRIMVLLSGSLPVVLGITGWWRWRHKRRAVRLVLARRRSTATAAVCQREEGVPGSV